MRCGSRLTHRFRRVPASLCLVATLVMVSPYQGKVNGILTLAGQQAKKPEYDKKKTPCPSTRCYMRGGAGRYTVLGGTVRGLALFLLIGGLFRFMFRMRGGLM